MPNKFAFSIVFDRDGREMAYRFKDPEIREAYNREQNDKELTPYQELLLKQARRVIRIWTDEEVIGHG